MPSFKLPKKIKRNLNLQVDLELLLLSIKHEEFALNIILEKLRTMVRCFYSYRGRKLCKEDYLKVDKTYYQVEKAIEYKLKILEYKKKDILDFSNKNKIKLSIDLECNPCNNKNLFKL